MYGYWHINFTKADAYILRILAIKDVFCFGSKINSRIRIIFCHCKMIIATFVAIMSLVMMLGHSWLGIDIGAE